MIVSWNWLTEYVRLGVSVEKLTEKLALAGLNHEATHEIGGDLAIDLEVTSNRPDCLSHLGVAREIGVLLGEGFKSPIPRPIESGPNISGITKVQVEDANLCPRFTARVVRGAKIGPSPWWLRKRIETIGLRPINNVVDITNYVMFECGQPLHGYDLDKLVEKRLVVRLARPGESLIAINNRKYELTASMLVIADAAGPVGLAGVMGGLETEIGAATTSIVIEAARFDPGSVRKTGRVLGLSSDASFRFERGLDPERTEWASRRCAELVLELAGGKLCEGLIDVGGPVGPRSPITLRFGRITHVLGIPIESEKTAAILQALGIVVVSKTPETLVVTPPSWRPDLEREIDLIEEVARIYGYEKIPEDRPVPMALATRGSRERVETEIRSTLAGSGFDEAVTLSLVTDALAVPIGMDPQSLPPPIRVEHSTRKRETVLRRSLVPSLLSARGHNEAHGSADAWLFEIANVYLPKPGSILPHEPARLAMVAGLDFVAMKGIVEAILKRLHISITLDAVPIDSPFLSRGMAAELRLGELHLGYVGEVAREKLDEFNLRSACSAAELDLEVLVWQARLVAQYRPLADHPAVTRDLSLVVPIALSWSSLATVVNASGGPYLESVIYLDSFRGGNLSDDEQSVHFGLAFRSPERTLTGEEADASVTAIVSECGHLLKAKLRT